MDPRGPGQTRSRCTFIYTFLWWALSQWSLQKKSQRITHRTHSKVISIPFNYAWGKTITDISSNNKINDLNMRQNDRRQVNEKRTNNKLNLSYFWFHALGKMLISWQPARRLSLGPEKWVIKGSSSVICLFSGRPGGLTWTQTKQAVSALTSCVYPLPAPSTLGLHHFLIWIAHW